jgi:hypothetical protein
VRKKVNIYLSEEAISYHRRQAERDGISLSAQLVRTLRWHEQIDDLQTWLADRFERLEGQLGKAEPDEAKTVVTRMLLELVALDHLPVETLRAILRDLREEVEGMTDKQREHYAAKGRELLARMNGGSK